MDNADALVSNVDSQASAANILRCARKSRRKPLFKQRSKKSKRNRGSLVNDQQVSNGPRCCFCRFGNERNETCGELKTIDNLSVHRLCTFFASNLTQDQPEKASNFWGFAPEGIIKEIRRGIRLKCKFCKLNHAVVGCCYKSCTISYHFPCALEEHALPVYCDSFSLYCELHRPRQPLDQRAAELLDSGLLDDELANINCITAGKSQAEATEPNDSKNKAEARHSDDALPRAKRRRVSGKDQTRPQVTMADGSAVTSVNRRAAMSALASLTTDCPICRMPLHLTNDLETVHGLCCRRAFFHRSCIQQYARSAGFYHFSCPFCRNRDRFSIELSKFGIEIPVTDAEWEKEPNAYADLLQRPSRCEAPSCINPAGRDAHFADVANENSSNDVDSQSNCSAIQQPNRSTRRSSEARRKSNSKLERFELVYCATCGHHAVHRACAVQAGWRRAMRCEEAHWNCEECAALNNQSINSSRILSEHNVSGSRACSINRTPSSSDPAQSTNNNLASLSKSTSDPQAPCGYRKQPRTLKGRQRSANTDWSASSSTIDANQDECGDIQSTPLPRQPLSAQSTHLPSTRRRIPRALASNSSVPTQQLQSGNIGENDLGRGHDNSKPLHISTAASDSCANSDVYDSGSECAEDTELRLRELRVISSTQLVIVRRFF